MFDCWASGLKRMIRRSFLDQGMLCALNTISHASKYLEMQPVVYLLLFTSVADVTELRVAAERQEQHS